MKKLSIILFSIFLTQLLSQNSLISVDDKDKDIGSQGNIYKVKANYIIQNNQDKNLYLLRADAEKEISISTSKKTLKKNDTAVIEVEFIPRSTGRFHQVIKLVTSADDTPYKLSLSGNIKSIQTDDKTACYYFNKPNKTSIKMVSPIAFIDTVKIRDNSNRIPDNYNSNYKNKVLLQSTQNIDPKQESKLEIVKQDNTLLNDTLYKANNIIFLIDLSSSMKNPDKLPVMQQALHELINVIRPKDKITIITYADSVKLVREAIAGDIKKDLHNVIDQLKAKGLTKGKKAILYSLDIAIRNYISDGNNEMILATDGKFRFTEEDQAAYLSRQGKKYIKLSTLALGSDREAMKNLKEIADLGKGNFVHIKKITKAGEDLIDEIKKSSLIEKKKD